MNKGTKLQLHLRLIKVQFGVEEKDFVEGKAGHLPPQRGAPLDSSVRTISD